MKNNYNKLMYEEIEKNKTKKKLLLHSCCGPCSSSVIERLNKFFDITIFYYNPNIEPLIEYEKRKKEQIRLLKELNLGIDFKDCDYENEEFKKVAKGLEQEKEGGARCHKCYYLRLKKTHDIALKDNFDYFCTTLTVSPYKNADVINELGFKLSDKVKFLPSDFKKEDGYKRSIQLSKKYNLYRQNYCGCLYSKQREDIYCKE